MIEPKDVKKGERYIDNNNNVIEVIGAGSDSICFVWVAVPFDMFLQGWTSYVPFLDDNWSKLEKP